MSDATSSSTTLGVVLGASKFPAAESIRDKESFDRSAKAFRDYLLSADGLDLPIGNLLVLFDSDLAAQEIDEKLSEWIEDRIGSLKRDGVEVRDLIVYYVGHGCFSEDGASFALAVKRTRGEKPFHSSYSVASLAATLRQKAGRFRKYVILDCCFSASAYTEFMSTGPLEVARQKTEAELPAAEQSARRGTALLCASGPRDPAKAPDHLNYTMFSESLMKTLSQGHEEAGENMSLSALGRFVKEDLVTQHLDAAVRPQVLSPEQSKGDVAQIGIFPNPYLRYADLVGRLRRLEEKLLVLQEANKSFDGSQAQSAENPLAIKVTTGFGISAEQYANLPSTLQDELISFRYTLRFSLFWLMMSLGLCCYLWIAIILGGGSNTAARSLSHVLEIKSDVFLGATIACLLAGCSLLSSEFEGVWNTVVSLFRYKDARKSIVRKRSSARTYLRQYPAIGTQLRRFGEPRFAWPRIPIFGYFYGISLTMLYVTSVCAIVVRFFGSLQS